MVGKMGTSLAARHLEIIFVSTLRSEIGLQLTMKRLSLSFFSNSLMIACRWDVDNFPTSAEYLTESKWETSDVSRKNSIDNQEILVSEGVFDISSIEHENHKNTIKLINNCLNFKSSYIMRKIGTEEPS